MRKSVLPLALCFLVSFVALTARERLPIDYFARTPDTSGAKLSPDGRYFAFVREYLGHRTLHVSAIDKRETTRILLGPALLANGADKDVAGFSWVSGHRLIITTSVWDMLYGVLAVDSDGRNAVPISGYEDERVGLNESKLFNREVIHRFFDADQRVLMLDRHEDTPGSANRPDVLLVDTSTGMSSLLLKNPGEVRAWLTDANGVVRLGILSHGELSGAIYRDSEKAPWRTILPLKRRRELRPVGFESTTNRVFLQSMTEDKRWTVFPMDPETGAIGGPILSDPEYDILPQHFVPAIDGHALCSPIFSPKTDALLGLRYVTDAPRVRWFDPGFARMQSAIDHLAPNTVNLLVDISRDGKRMLWFGYSDQNPGGYYLADLAQHTVGPLARTCSWVKPDEMAQMLAVKYQARDGLLIHGFLTVPVGHQPKGLPLVVMPHGGPWVRDVWGYDPFVQLLANRGYAVLQMNYRGSPGYGEELYANAKREIGGEIQDDIEDATRWAIAAGVADPKRIAICGASYGGYSALFALGHNPDLYRCGISLGGVTDWPAMYRKSDVAEYKQALQYWREQIGDPSKDLERLKVISPVNFPEKIVAPVLIIQGKEDRRVPTDQARRMIAALEKAGHKPESLFLSGVGHNFGKEKSRVEIYQTVTRFLEANLGPGVD
ncbi:MAG TPA: S9 family peptidase [Opitutaceae bacterium]|nr:S9 family peptidase [Opitutaceae bacterium]